MWSTYTLTSKNTNPTKTPNNTTKITHHTPKIQNRSLYRKPQEKSNKKTSLHPQKMRYKNLKFYLATNSPHYKTLIKSTKITHLHSDTKITYKNTTKKDLRISTKVFNSMPL